MKKKLLYVILSCLLCFIMLNFQTDFSQAATRKLTDISAEYTGDDLAYGDDIDKDDIRVKAYYSGSSKGYRLDSSEFEIDPEEIEDESGTQRVTVSYTDEESGITKTTRIRITIRDPYLESIEVEYTGSGVVVGGSIPKEDVEVIAHYEDGTDDDVTNWYLNDYNIKEGTNKITVYYEENGKKEKAYIEVDGYKANLTGISANYYGPTLKAGEQVNRSNISVTGKYTVENRYRTITSDLSGWTLSDYVLLPGDNVLTVNYREGNNTYTTTITVKANPGNAQWVKENNKWYYLQNDGTYKKNSWLQDNGKWYYFLKDGSMATGWIIVDNQWYYMNSEGKMMTGWASINGKWYFMNRSGQMMTGWILVDGKYYFMDKTGAMITNSWVGNYYVDPNGVWTQTK